VFVWRYAHRAGTSQVAAGQLVQRVGIGELDIAVLSPTGTLHQGRNTFTLEFRSADGRLTEVGAVGASANMRMPGMAMSGGLEVRRIGVGRYEATAEFGMAGTWQMTIAFDGPSGHDAVNFEGAVQ
jgi:hypothetical protein